MMRVKNIFIKETSDNLAVLEKELNNPDKGELSVDAVEKVISTMHNIKGTAPMLGFNMLPELAIPVEQVYKDVKESKIIADKTLVEKTQSAVSIIQDLLFNDEAHTPQSKEEQEILVDFFNDINRLKAQTNDR